MAKALSERPDHFRMDIQRPLRRHRLKPCGTSGEHVGCRPISRLSPLMASTMIYRPEARSIPAGVNLMLTDVEGVALRPSVDDVAKASEELPRRAK